MGGMGLDISALYCNRPELTWCQDYLIRIWKHRWESFKEKPVATFARHHPGMRNSGQEKVKSSKLWRNDSIASKFGKTSLQTYQASTQRHLRRFQLAFGMTTPTKVEWRYRRDTLMMWRWHRGTSGQTRPYWAWLSSTKTRLFKELMDQEKLYPESGTTTWKCS